MSQEPKKKAVAYVRVSSQKQLDNESPETQKNMIQQYADTNNIEIIAWFNDEGVSAKNADREELQNLLKYALQYKGKIDHVIVYKMNRASRNLDTYVQSVRLVLQSKGITVRSATEPVDETKMGRFMEGLFVLLGQLDNDSKSEYTIDNMKALAEQGYWQHPPITGYDMHKIQNDLGKPRPTLKPNKDVSKVKQVLERFSQGDITKAELARYSKEIGLRSRYGTPLSEDSINRLLKSPIYAGYVTDNFTNYELVEGKHEPIISKATYDTNLALLSANKERKGKPHKMRNPLYPLKGLIKCEHCDGLLYGSAPRTGSGKYSPRYHCARTSCKGKAKSIKAGVVHEDFSKYLREITPSDKILKLYKKVLIKEAGLELKRMNEKIQRLRDELDSIANKRTKIIMKFSEDLITLEDKNQLIETLDEAKLSKSLELKELERLQQIKESDIESAINFMKTTDKQWENSELDLKTRFQNLIFPDGVVYHAETRKFGTSNLNTLYRCAQNKKGSIEPSESNLVAGAGLEPATFGL